MIEHTHHAKELSKIDIPSLDLRIKSLQQPDEEVTTIKVKSARKGEDEKVQTKEIPFACEIGIDGPISSQLKQAIGVQHNPTDEISLSLSLKDAALKMTTSLTYSGEETRYKTESYNHRWVSEGQHYPYGPVEPGYMDCDQREVPYTVEVEKNEVHKNVAVSKEAFNALYLGIVNSGEAKSKSELLTFLHENFRDECRDAQAAIKQTMAKYVQEAQQRAQHLSNVFDGVTLPQL